MKKHYTEILKAHALFSTLKEEQVEEIGKQCTLLSYAKGHTLFMQEDPASLAYIVVSGWVKLFRHTVNGEEYIVDVLPAGYLFGENAIFHGDSYSCGAEIAEDATLLSIPLAALKQHIDHTPGFAQHMLSHASRQQTAQERNKEHLVIQSAPQRIGCFLLQLAPKEAKEPVTLHLPYDKLLLAARLGMQRETLSRGLTTLQDATDITIQGATVNIPNLGKLTKYCCTACTSNYPCEE